MTATRTHALFALGGAVAAATPLIANAAQLVPEQPASLTIFAHLSVWIKVARHVLRLEPS